MRKSILSGDRIRIYIIMISNLSDAFVVCFMIPAESVSVRRRDGMESWAMVRRDKESVIWDGCRESIARKWKGTD